ncbi:MAG TPA: hypothetical protein PKL55_09275, partial [Syntrophales bacterium]|nr:hypothetical protein [Syntrophales bacterium]
MDACIQQFVFAVIRYHPSVAPADELGQPFLIHKLQMVSDRPLAQVQAAVLHPAGNDAGPHGIRAFTQNFKDMETLSFDVFDIKEMLHMAISIIDEFVKSHDGDDEVKSS